MKHLKKYNESWYDNDVLNFLYQLDELNNQLSEDSSDGWWMDLSYEFDETKDTIDISFGASGYSEGWHHNMKVYYKESPVGEIRVEEDESSSGPYGGDASSDTKYYGDFDEIVKEIKSHYGL
jgi:hypothetical protein